MLDERRSLAHIVRLCMEHTTNAFQLGMTRNLVEVGFEILSLRPAASHDAFERVVRLIGKREQMLGLTEHIGLIDIGFQMH